jgi:hypothetical protein
MPRRLYIAFIAIVLLNDSTTATAEYLIGVTRNNDVYRISSDFLQVTKLNQVETQWQFDCLAQDSMGRLIAFASTDINLVRSVHLIELDPVTGAVVSDRDITALTPTSVITASAFSPDGILYGVSWGEVNGVFSQQFVKVHPDTGNTDVLGQLSGLFVTGMDFDSHGDLYGWGTGFYAARGIVRVDLDSLTLEALLEPSALPQQEAIAVDSHNRLISGGSGGIIPISMPSGQLGGYIDMGGISFTGLEFIVPEPASSFLAFGLAGVLLLRRRK